MLPSPHSPAARSGSKFTFPAVLGSSVVPLLAALAVTLTWRGAPAAEVNGQPVAEGRALFAHQWREDDPETPTGDGLGPMFNARSCAECHSLGGIGGGGGREHDVDLLNLILPERKEGLDRVKFADGVGKIHPTLLAGFSVRPSITLHKFAANPAYEKWRVALVMLTSYLRTGVVPERVSFEITHRNTPALFGAGLIDSIPRSVLEDVAWRQSTKHGSVKGKVAVATGGGAGKFGWRGQTASLKQFVMGACANELGLQVPENDQPQDPLDPAGKAPGLDLDQEQCDALVAYVASLPPPAERLPLSIKQKELWTAGGVMFKQIGCAECHLPKLGDVAGIYSDLLLHDMGQELADPAGTNLPTGAAPVFSTFVAYYGGPQNAFVDVPPETKRQWRTPPLWGVVDTPPYLHDGSAPTLEEAILMHGGEGATSRKKYEALSFDNRAKLLGYLESLGQPAK